MPQEAPIETALSRIEARLDAIDQKLDGLALAKRKSLEWIAKLSEHISSLDSFREEVRASLEPLFTKMETTEDSLRVLRHATSDVSRRVEAVERERQNQASAS